MCKMLFSLSILTVLPAISIAFGVSTHKAAVELYYSSNYTYFPIESNFIRINFLSKESVSIALTGRKLFPTVNDDPSTLKYPPLYEFFLYKSEKSPRSSRCHFSKNGDEKAVLETPKILSSDRHIEVFIYWSQEFLVLSRAGNMHPVYSWMDNPWDLNTIKFIGVRVGDRNSTPSVGENHWMIDFQSAANLPEPCVPYLES